MDERVVDINTADGRMETFTTHPEADGPFPAVIIYMDIWGVREELYDIARRIGTLGYYCLVPDFYYRQGKIRFEFRNDRNQTISLNRLGEEDQRRVRAPLQQLSNRMVMDDTAAILSFINNGEPVQSGGMGSIGYCMGGRHVLCAAGTFPEHFIASASLHGTSLISDRDDAPHLLADTFRGELYCGFGEHDPYTPPDLIQTLQDSMQSCAVHYRFIVHPGAEHGYALPDRDVYDKRAATRDWECIFAMFQRQIPPYIPGNSRG